MKREEQPYTNPFIVGRPIQEDSLFVGRESIKYTILSNLSNLGSACVIGERRSGKTSLLLALARRINATPQLQSPLVTFMDCSYLSSVDDFWSRFITQLRSATDGQLASQVDALCSAGQLEAWASADRILKGVTPFRPIVMLLDEFDYVLEKETFAGDFLLKLREYASHNKVAFVTASRRHLVTHYVSSTPSPFFNIFLTAVLTPFSEDETLTLLNKSNQDGSPVFGKDELQFLTQVSGCYPYFVQLAGSLLYSMKYGFREKPKALWREELEQKFDVAARQHFEYYWSKSSPDERRILHKLATGGEAVVQQTEAVKQLLERGLIRYSNEHLIPFSTLWAAWIKERSWVDAKEKDTSENEVDVLVSLRNIFLDRFDEDELRDLCFHMEIKYADLSGAGVSAKTRELVNYCKRHDRMRDLVATGQRVRPDIEWPTFWH